VTSLRQQAAVLHCFSRTAREQGVIFCSPEEISSWFSDVLSKALDEAVTARLVQEVVTDLEASGHLKRVEAEEVVAWSLPNAIGRNCVCGCGCTADNKGKPTCWPCWSQSKRLGPAGHIQQVLEREARTHCDCGGTLVLLKNADAVCAACGTVPA
jgi:hypothetical protein